MQSRFSRARRRALVAAFAATAATVSLAAASPAGAVPGTADTARNSQWTSFANSNGDWNGADGTIAHAISGGRVMWRFSDTFKGPVTSNGVRPPFQTGFVNNSMVVQSSASTSASLSSVQVGGTGWDAKTLVTPPSGTGWFWAGDGWVSSGSADMLYMAFGPASGCDIFGKHYGTYAQKFTIGSGAPAKSGSPRPVGNQSTDIMWGTATLDAGSYTYIYGAELPKTASCAPLGSYLHIARVPLHDFDATWSYLTNGSWTTSGQGSRIVSGVSSEFSVSAVGGKYALVTQQFGGDGIISLSSSTPYGFSASAVSPVLYHAPEYGSTRLVYAARLQPALSNSTTSVLSYNVNTTRSSTDACASENQFKASIYRPRFVKVPTSALLQTGGSTAATGSASGSTVTAASTSAATSPNPFPVQRIAWDAGANCSQVDKAPTGVKVTMNSAHTGATISWNFGGPTLFTTVYRTLGMNPEGKLPFMLVGAWPVPNVPSVVANVSPSPATGTTTRVVLDDPWGVAWAYVSYRVCFARWGGAPETCAAPVFG